MGRCSGLIRCAEGIVHKILETDGHVQYVKVKMVGKNTIEDAIHYNDFLPPLKQGDHVILNTTAVDLRLGSGGYHYVMWNQSVTEHRPDLRGHIMKARYTPWQLAIQTVEEQTSPHHDIMKRATDLAGMPVLVGELHSMLPIVVSSLIYRAREHRHPLHIGYVMTDGAALPLKLSQHVKTLQQLGWLKGTVTVGHAFGGDLEAVNIFSGLLAAKHVLNVDLTIVLMGPGIVGTGTPFGFSGIEQGQIVNAIHALNGRPIVIPRISFKDSRDRHRGVSHHTVTNLQRVILRPTIVPYPIFHREQWQRIISKQFDEIKRSDHTLVPVRLDESTVKKRIALYPDAITTMGRDIDDDPAFFIGVSAAADVGWSLVSTTR